MSENSGDNNPITDFIVIGAGNVGTHLALELSAKGMHPVQIINRSIEKAERLASLTGTNDYSSELRITQRADFILVTVNDDSLPEVLVTLNKVDIPIFHCSGSTSMSIFSPKFPHHGVIYPLQTFTVERNIDFKQIPILLEASDEMTMKILRRITAKLSKEVLEVNSKDRLKYHIAAVFANNFTNHFLTLANDYLKKNHLSGKLLYPLIRETFQKFIEKGDSNVQTGPAVREDIKTLLKHEEMLKNDQDFQKIYTFVSRSIININKEKESK